MTGFNNAMEVFKLLDRSNCKDCREATCLAFAVAVTKGGAAATGCSRTRATGLLPSCPMEAVRQATIAAGEMP